MTEPRVSLAPLQVADLDRARLRDLATDVAALTTDLDVLVKTSEGYVDPDVRPTLDDAISALVAGTVRALQLRYRFDGRLYWDTILTTPNGFRLVRTDVTATMNQGTAP